MSAGGLSFVFLPGDYMPLRGRSACFHDKLQPVL